MQQAHVPVKLALLHQSLTHQWLFAGYNHRHSTTPGSVTRYTGLKYRENRCQSRRSNLHRIRRTPKSSLPTSLPNYNQFYGGPGGIRTRDLPDVWFELANRAFFGPRLRSVYQAELPAHFPVEPVPQTFNHYQPQPIWLPDCTPD